MPRLSRGAAFHYFSADAAEAPVLDAGNLEPLAGFLYASPRAGTIFVEQTDSVTRRRFTVAHELGHYLLHLRPFFQSLEPGDEAAVVAIADLHRDDDGEFGPVNLPDASRLGGVEVMGEAYGGGLLPPHEVMEREADGFASELLMPEAFLRELIVNGFAELREMDLVWRLAADLLVSVAAMSRRLCDLGIIAAR
jgi:Zn-dependent peptidase ImmA (M78 family)